MNTSRYHSVTSSTRSLLPNLEVSAAASLQDTIRTPSVPEAALEDAQLPLSRTVRLWGPNPVETPQTVFTPIIRSLDGQEDPLVIVSKKQWQLFDTFILEQVGNDRFILSDPSGSSDQECVPELQDANGRQLAGIFKIRSFNQIIVNGNPLEPGMKVVLNSGDRLESFLGTFRFFIQPSEETNSQNHDFLNCIQGRKTVWEVSSKVRDDVLKMMEHSLETLNSRLPLASRNPILEDRHLLRGGHPVEQQYHALKEAHRLHQNIHEAETLEELKGVLRKFRIQTFEDHSYLTRDLMGEQLAAFQRGEIAARELPRFLRQKAKDLSNDIVCPKNPEKRELSAFHQLDEKKKKLLEKVQSLKIQSEEILETIRQVLDRAKPLEMVTRDYGVRSLVMNYMQEVSDEALRLYPMEWVKSRGRNFFTGEAIADVKDTESYVQTRYRYARMLFNFKVRKPVFGEPTESELFILREFVSRYLRLKHEKASYQEIQQLIRYHFSHFTPELKESLKEVNEQTRGLVIETFFGNHQHREFVDPYQSFELIRALGEVGYYRELGVTLESVGENVYTTVSLGDMSSVSPENHHLFFVLHTHPERYLNEEGEIMGDHGGATFWFPAIKEASHRTRHILFSDQDIRLYLQNAQRLFGIKNQSSSEVSIIYDPNKRLYRNWVQHPYGLSEITISLNKKGKPKEAIIRYALTSTLPNLDNGYWERAEELKNLSQQLGIPIEVIEVADPKLLFQSLPRRGSDSSNFL